MESVNRVPAAWNTLVAGMATTVALWVAWFILHHPAIGLEPRTNFFALSAVHLVSLTVFSARWIRGKHAPGHVITHTTIAGMLAGAINLAAMGSMLVAQSDPSQGMQAGGAAPTNQPPLGMMLGVYLGVCLASGLLAGLLAATLFPPRERAATASDVLQRAALTLLAATLPLLLVGGLVTSYRSGLAVPDWPNTYAGNMFLYPISLMASNKHVHLEHSHRLFGTLVGMTSILVAITAWKLDDRRWVRFWALAILGLVIFQGILGGFRVTEQSKWYAVGHGVLAQVVFLLMAMFAGYVSRAYREGPTTEEPNDRRRRAIGTAIVHSLILQLIFGAMYRHTGSPHALYTHIGFSFIVASIGLMAGMAATSRSGPADAFNSAVRRGGSMLAATVILQFILGWGAWAANPPAEFRPVPKPDQLATLPPLPAWKAGVRTAHQANGALLIGSAGYLFVFVRRFRRGKAGSAVPSVDPTPDPALSASARP